MAKSDRSGVMDPTVPIRGTGINGSEPYVYVIHRGNRIQTNYY